MAGDSSEDVTNTLRYSLYLAERPTEHRIKEYEEYVESKSKHEGQSPLRLKFQLSEIDDRTLCGKLKFDERIEDEWLAIYALYELSRFDASLVISVSDDDGNILLIEAAEHLPPWLESKKSKDRVFIHQGKLHTYPEQFGFEDKPEKASRAQVAADFIRAANGGKSPSNVISSHINTYRVKTAASSAIQGAIREQLAGLPDRRIWLSRKFKQLDEIITDNSGENRKSLDNRLREDKLTLASVMAMTDEELDVSSISSVSSSRSASPVSSVKNKSVSVAPSSSSSRGQGASAPSFPRND